MNEERFDIGIPVQTFTLEELHKIGKNVNAILAQKSQRQWRHGDVAFDQDGSFFRYICSDDYINELHSRFLFNLRDLLAHGPIVVAITEETAEHLEASHGSSDLWLAFKRQVREALACYRKQIT